jgi:ATP-binding cassette, subfamily B, bacterial PglK
MLLRETWSLLTPRQKRWVVWAQALSILMAFTTVAGIASIVPFFAVLGNPKAAQHAGFVRWLYVHLGFSDGRSFEVALGLGFIAIVVLSNVINIGGAFILARIAASIGADLQSALFGEYLARPFVFHARTNSAELFNNIIHSTSRATNEVLQNLFVLLTNVATGTFIVISVMLLNPLVAALMFISLAGGYACIYLFVRNRLLQAGRLQSDLFTEQTKVVNESLGAIKEILILRAQAFFQGVFAQATFSYARSASQTRLINQSPKHIMECVAVLGLVLVALLAGGGGEGVGPRLGQLTFLAFAAYRLLPTLQQAFGAIVHIRAGSAEFATIAPHLMLARTKQTACGESGPSWRLRPQRDICLSNISFRYAPDGPSVIDRVSLSIPAGGAVGFIGTNGSGKTTLVDIIAGLLVPDSGRMEVDGVRIDPVNRAQWSSRIAYVPQNVYLLDTTIARNVALGVPEEAIDRQRLIEAARLAQLDEFVGTLPFGYEHVVGERGMRLSGGQRQRIGIARALYTDASVLILDEATTALDGLSERDVMETLLRLRGTYTVILIAHRLSMVRACDAVFRVDNGRIAATGTYREVLEVSSESQQQSDFFRGARILVGESPTGSNRDL